MGLRARSYNAVSGSESSLVVHCLSSSLISDSIFNIKVEIIAFKPTNKSTDQKHPYTSPTLAPSLSIALVYPDPTPLL